MKDVIIIQASIGIICGAALVVFLGSSQAASFFAGASVMLINFAILAWTWSRILKKKQIAIATTIIVFKYGIFAVIVYEAFKHPALQPLWFCVGLATILPTVILAAIKIKMLGGKDVI